MYTTNNRTVEGLAGKAPSCWSDLIWGPYIIIIAIIMQYIIIIIIIINFQMAESNRSLLYR